MSDEVDFLDTDKHENLLQIDPVILMGIVKHSQSSQNSKFAMTLCNIPKKVRNGVHIVHAVEHQSFYKLVLLLLMEVARQKYRNCFCYIYIYACVCVKNELMKWADFLHAGTNYWVGMLKNRGDLLDHGTIKSGVSHKSFDESRKKILACR